MKRFALLFLCAVTVDTLPGTCSRGGAPLRLVRTIPMPDVKGRIDHMALDVARHRLFVAALGNNTLEVLDLRSSRVVQTVAGLEEPQGVAYVPGLDRLFVASGGDGKCHVYSGEPLRQLSVLDLGEDADNVRCDAAGGRLYVGYGSGAIAAIDPSTLKRLGSIRLEGHPESFQLEKQGPKVYVNVPDAGQVTVLDRVKLEVLSKWPLNNLRSNFPMALTEGGHRVLIATRRPPRLVVLDSGSGKTVAVVNCAGDADDLYYDEARQLVYMSCGEGVIDVFAEQDVDLYREVARIPTARGARTSLWSPDLKQLFLAVPAGSARPAGISIYQQE